jgi:biotin carboxylase
MGDKSSAKETMIKAGVPTIPGSVVVYLKVLSKQKPG